MGKSETVKNLTRRNLIKGVALTGAALALPLGASSARAASGSQRSPDQVLKDLMAGNQRFVKGEPHVVDLAATRAGLATSQSPDTIVLRCADSRVSPEVVFDQTLGDLFICAVAGNIPTHLLIASMEYSIAVLGSSLIVVMGHSGCGAVDATIKNANDTSALPGNLPALADQILPAVIKARAAGDASLAGAIRVNAQMAAKRLPNSSTIINEAWSAGKLKIVSGVYQLDTGIFELDAPVNEKKT